MTSNKTMNDSYVDKYKEERKNKAATNEAPNKGASIFKLIFNVILMAILFGGVASAVFLVVTDTMKQDEPTGNNILTATSIPYIGEDSKESTDDTETDSKEVIAPVSSVVDVSNVVESVSPAIVTITTYEDAAEEELDTDLAADIDTDLAADIDTDSAADLETDSAADLETDSAAETENGMVEKSSRTGVLIGQNDTSAMILSAYSSFDTSDVCYVTLANGSEIEASFRGHDEETGIAVFEIEFSKMTEEDLNMLRIITMGDSIAAKAGQLVIACDTRIYVGYISSMAEKYLYGDDEFSLIKTDITADEDCFILINSNAELLGIKTNADISDDNVIPISMIKKRLLEIIENDPERPAYLGVLGKDIDSDYSELFDVPEGVYVKDVEVGSPAEEAGILVGDIICRVDDNEVSEMEKLDKLITSLAPGTEIKVVLWRAADADTEVSEKTEEAEQSEADADIAANDNDNETVNDNDNETVNDNDNETVNDNDNETMVVDNESVSYVELELSVRLGQKD